MRKMSYIVKASHEGDDETALVQTHLENRRTAIDLAMNYFDCIEDCTAVWVEEVAPGLFGLTEKRVFLQRVPWH